MYETVIFIYNKMIFLIIEFIPTREHIQFGYVSKGIIKRVGVRTCFPNFIQHNNSWKRKTEVFYAQQLQMMKLIYFNLLVLDIIIFMNQ